MNNDFFAIPLFKKLIYPFLFSVLTGSALIAQSPNETNYKFTLHKATGPIKIDGKPDDESWKNAQVITRFKQAFPSDTGYAVYQTIVKVLYDEKFLYISAVCYQDHFVVQSLRRDFPNGSTDIFLVMIDPFRDKLNGFYFAVSPYGVQKEGLIYNGTNVNIDWDNKWYSNAVRYKDRYEVEMAIPFKTLRYKTTEGLNEWNINFTRNNLHDNERSCWAPIPLNFPLFNVAFNGTMKWDAPPPAPGANISVIPYVAASHNKDFLNNSKSNKTDAGFDAKIAITPSLNLDLTVNPDFSQVEVDQQITNLSRFELFFPERRQFFLENNDLFNSFGNETANPFFSRRIGLYYNKTKDENVRVPIIAGARLSGRVDKNWRIGFLNMQTAAKAEDSLPSVNYTVAVLQRRIGLRSNISVIGVNKQASVNDKTSKDFLEYNRIAGAEYNYASPNGKFYSKLFYHHEITPRNTSSDFASGGALSYASQRLFVEATLNNVGKNYLAETGFVPRNGYIQQASNFSFNFFPKGKAAKQINYFSIIPDYDLLYGKNDKRVTDLDYGLFFSIRFQNNAELSGALLRWDYTYLFDDFDPTNKYEAGKKVLLKGSSYSYFSNRLQFSSSARNNFSLISQLRVGEYFNGRIFSWRNTVGYRLQPYGIFSVNVNYSRIRLPEGYSNADFWLIGPKVDLTFTKSIFFTTFVQYNNQTNNININSRFQWRFKPVSDFFLVYTDNYFAQDDEVNQIKAWGKKTKAIVAKLTYWFNL